MDSVIGQFAQFGFGGLCCGFMLWALLKDNNRLKDDADKENEWKIQTIQRQTEAAFTLSHTLVEMTKTIASLVEICKRIEERSAK